MTIEEVLAEIADRLEWAQDEYKSASRMDINSYGPVMR